jgi:hypothetical protein
MNIDNAAVVRARGELDELRVVGFVPGVVNDRAAGKYPLIPRSIVSSHFPLFRRLGVIVVASLNIDPMQVNADEPPDH